MLVVLNIEMAVQIHAMSPCQVEHHLLTKFHVLQSPVFQLLLGIPISVKMSQGV